MARSDQPILFEPRQIAKELGVVSATPVEKATRVRLQMLALISGAVAVNYLDRAIIGVAAPLIAKEFALSAAVMGVVFSAFSWSYFAFQIPSGVALDRFGARVIYLVAIAGWSFSTAMHATVRGLGSLVGWRLSLGVFEAPCFPANSNIVAAWFPRSERARSIGVYTAAEYVALGFATPLLLWILATYGWRALFFLSGGLGLTFTVLWWAFYRDPGRSRANAAELSFIGAGGGARVDGFPAALARDRPAAHGQGAWPGPFGRGESA